MTASLTRKGIILKLSHTLVVGLLLAILASGHLARSDDTDKEQDEQSPKAVAEKLLRLLVAGDADKAKEMLLLPADHPDLAAKAVSHIENFAQLCRHDNKVFVYESKTDDDLAIVVAAVYTHHRPVNRFMLAKIFMRKHDQQWRIVLSQFPRNLEKQLPNAEYRQRARDLQAWWVDRAQKVKEREKGKFK